MQRITLAGRLIITLIVVAAVYFGFRYFAGDKLGTPATTSANTQIATEPGNAVVDNNSPAASTAASSTQPFAYEAPAPVNGKLKGVVELGASGFNSFIVRIDKDRNWKMEKAEFGNSLVMENMASDDDVRKGLKAYIGQMLDFGVAGRDIHFVVSSGAIKAENTGKIIKALKSLNYVVNTVTPEKEGILGLRSVLPPSYADKAFVTDIG